jgi:hypothetical protein
MQLSLNYLRVKWFTSKMFWGYFRTKFQQSIDFMLSRLINVVCYSIMVKQVIMLQTRIIYRVSFYFVNFIFLLSISFLLYLLLAQQHVKKIILSHCIIKNLFLLIVYETLNENSFFENLLNRARRFRRRGL